MEPEPDLIIRAAVAADEGQWRRLWTDFNAFHGVRLPERVANATWQRIRDEAAPMGCFVAVEDGEVVGLADYVLHLHTWSEHLSCLLDDLYVRPESRGRGVGRRLVEAVVDLGRRSGWSRVYWLALDGADARYFYDKHWRADGVERYTVRLESWES
jgi:GNAT superfamily N-acetyltransferase